MSDAHDETARQLVCMPGSRGRLAEVIAAALRKAAADERELARERAAQIAETHIGYHVNGVAHSVAAAIRSDGCDGCLACRARAKGGA